MILFRNVATLTAVLKEPTTDNERALCPQFEPLVEFDRQKDNQKCQETNEDTST